MKCSMRLRTRLEGGVQQIDRRALSQSAVADDDPGDVARGDRHVNRLAALGARDNLLVGDVGFYQQRHADLSGTDLEVETHPVPASRVECPTERQWNLGRVF